MIVGNSGWAITSTLMSASVSMADSMIGSLDMEKAKTNIRRAFASVGTLAGSILSALPMFAFVLVSEHMLLD